MSFLSTHECLRYEIFSLLSWRNLFGINDTQTSDPLVGPDLLVDPMVEQSFVEHSLVEHSLVEHSLASFVENSRVEHSLVEHSLVEHLVDSTKDPLVDP